MEKVISANGLSRSFKQYKKQAGLKGSIKSFFKREYFEIPAVSEIDIEIVRGERVGFIGPNGAGKTTTLKMFSGLLYPTSGQVEVLGHIPYRREADFQKKFSLLMGQKSQLWWELPAEETFLLNKEIYQVSDSDFVKNLKDLVELLEIEEVMKVPVRKLSLGQRMKCELAATLIHNPELIFLDEPTIGLDVMVQKRIRKFLLDFNKKNNTTFLLTSHYMDDVEELCERIIIIDKGRILYDGSKTNLVSKYVTKKYLKLNLSSEVSQSDVEKLGKVVKYDTQTLELVLSVDKKDHLKIAAEILQDLPIDDLDISEPNLEEIIEVIFSKDK